MEPYIRTIVQHNWSSFNYSPLISVDMIVKNLMKALLQSKNVVFVHVPGVESSPWPEHIKTRFYRDITESKEWRDSSPEKDWIFLELEGTTFSGHSTKTTLGNTMRSLCYAWYYQVTAGIS